MKGLVARTIGRLGSKAPRDLLFHFFKYGRLKDKVRCEICTALMRLQEKNVIPVLLEKTPIEPWMYLAMGFGGSIAHVSWLEAMARSGYACNELILAIGFLGCASSAILLVDHLENGPYSESAALSLFLITGAELFEDIPSSDPVEEFTLFDETRERTIPAAPLDQSECESATAIRQLSRCKMAWEEWWRINNECFDLQVSYRAGKPHSPFGILKILESEVPPPFLRGMVHDELVIRYGKDLGFDVSLTVKEQRNIIQKYKEWFADHGYKE
jgi:hypothetical protein